MAVQVILKTDIPKLGKKGTLVKVAPGYAHNFLFPKGLAVLVSEGALKDLSYKEKDKKEKQNRSHNQALEISKELSSKIIRIKAKSADEEKFFGSITSQDIKRSIFEEMKLDIDKRDIVIDHPIKNFGTHKIILKLTNQIKVQFLVEVIKE
ncbi:MAG: 50S ribosomal protein L9 [Armatimonadetes bacterium]|nr:50S ribosomal protein L9 [Armatimonadota bacterium]